MPFCFLFYIIFILFMEKKKFRCSFFFRLCECLFALHPRNKTNKQTDTFGLNCVALHYLLVYYYYASDRKETRKNGFLNLWVGVCNSFLGLIQPTHPVVQARSGFFFSFCVGFCVLSFFFCLINYIHDMM
jgi:hypothetical protein